MSTIQQILNWSEKYTKTDMTYLVKGGFWLLLSQALLFTLSFGLLWVFANYLEPEVYGQYRFFTTAVAILAIASLPGMHTATIRAVARGYSGLLPQILHTRLRWSILGTLAAFGAAGYYLWQGDTTMSGLFIITALFLPFYESFTLYNSYLIGRKDYRSFTPITVSQKVIMVIATVSAIIFTQNIFWILGSFMVSTALANIAIYYYTNHRWPINDQIETETIPYGKKLSLLGAIGTAAGQLDKIVLWYLTGPLSVASYTIASALPREVAGAFTQIGILALPKMSNQNKTTLRMSLLRKMLIFFLASLPVTLAYIIAAPLIFQLFLPQYLDYVFLSQVASVLILLTPITLLIQYFQATMHTRALYAMQFVLPVVLIGLFFLLIPSLGALGAVLATIGRQVASFFLLLYFFLTDTTTDSSEAQTNTIQP